MSESNLPIRSERVAATERLLEFLAQTNIDPGLWAEIILAADQSGALGSPDIPDCLDVLRARLGPPQNPQRVLGQNKT